MRHRGRCETVIPQGLADGAAELLVIIDDEDPRAWPSVLGVPLELQRLVALRSLGGAATVVRTLGPAGVAGA